MLWYPGTGLGIPGIEYGDGGVLEFGAEVPDCCVCTIEVILHIGEALVLF